MEGVSLRDGEIDVDGSGDTLLLESRACSVTNFATLSRSQTRKSNFIGEPRAEQLLRKVNSTHRANASLHFRAFERRRIERSRLRATVLIAIIICKRRKISDCARCAAKLFVSHRTQTASSKTFFALFPLVPLSILSSVSVNSAIVACAREFICRAHQLQRLVGDNHDNGIVSVVLAAERSSPRKCIMQTEQEREREIERQKICVCACVHHLMPRLN